MINFLKNFTIAFLMILAVYQTAELWFGKYPDHNFFSLETKSVSEEVNTDSSALNSLIVNIGNNRAVCEIFPKQENKESIDKMITQTVKKGSLAKEGSLDWKVLLSKRCFIYKYGFDMDGLCFESLFDVKNSNTSKIKPFDMIVLTPDSSDKIMYISFINTKVNEETVFVNGARKNYAEEAEELLTNYSKEERDIYYISSYLNGFNVFKGNIFIPQWQSEEFVTDTLEVAMPFEDKANTEKYADLFFDNPAGKWASVVNDVYTYSDENNVVKFYPDNTVEYSAYKANNSKNTDFYANYLAALRAVERDNVSMPVILGNCRHFGEKMIFSFDFVYNNIPVYMSPQLKKNSGMNHFIEVTLTNGAVTKYVRYGCELSSGDEKAATVDFVTAVDSIFNSLNKEEDQAVDMLSLAYTVDSAGKECGLDWIANIEGKEYTVSAYGKE